MSFDLKVRVHVRVYSYTLKCVYMGNDMDDYVLFIILV